MHETIAPPLLAHWEGFYVILGTSAAALTGLQFVVIALVAESRLHGTSAELAAFATPTIVHFSAALLVSAVLSAPWHHGLSIAAFVLAAAGAAGTGYAGLVARRATRQSGYQVVLEDWLWHIVFPAVAYTTIFVAALRLVRHPTGALFTIAGAALVLLFIGIHNAWDAVTYLVTQRLAAERRDAEREKPPPDRGA